MPPPPGPARRQFLKVAAVPSNSGRKPASGCGLTIGSGPGSTLAFSRSPVRRPSATPVSIGFGEPTVGKERGSGDVAIRGVVDAAEVVGHGVRDVVAHAHGAGVVMRGAEVVAAILECSERGESLRARCPPARDHAVRARAECRTARCRRRSARSCRRPRPSRPRSRDRYWSAALPGKSCGLAFALPR